MMSCHAPSPPRHDDYERTLRRPAAREAKKKMQMALAAPRLREARPQTAPIRRPVPSGLNIP
jgi:hypothetical protein